MAIKYSKRCATCQFMRKNPKFRFRVYNSSKYVIGSHESIIDIFEDVRPPVSLQMLYSHLKNHKFAEMSPDKRRKLADRRLANEGLIASPQSIVKQALENEVADYQQKPFHLQTLDTAISEFNIGIREGKIKLNAATGLTAIKLRIDYERSQKDRSTDLIKTLAGLAAPKQQ